MITRMKKVYLVLQKKDLVSSLEDLRDLGVVHVEELNAPESENISVLENAVKDYASVLEVLKTVAPVKKQKPAQDAREAYEELCAALSEIERLTDDIGKRQNLIAQWESWGDFRPQDLRALADEGIYAKLYEVPAGQVPQNVCLKEISVSGGVMLALAVSREPLDLPFAEAGLPPVSLSEMREQNERDAKEIQKLRKRIQSYAAYSDALQKYFLEQQDALRFEEVAASAGSDEDLAWLKGFCPENACDKLNAVAKSKSMGILFQNPSEDDHIPTQLKNPAWADLVKPVFDFAGILPGYREFDISKLFFVFFSLFFGMLIGDAAYGLIFLGFALFANFGMKMKDKTFVRYLFILSGVTIFWGVLTGTFFGQQWLPAWVHPLVPWLNETENIQRLCFIVGALHLSAAHIWRIMNFYTHKLWRSVINETGWFLLVWFMVYWANYFVLGIDLPGFWKIHGILAAVCILVKPDPLVPLTMINYFTDVVSYIRLYAVGLATVAVADAANNMSLFWVIFLHTLNIVLAMLAILVHALRLNTLEFSGHLGVEWSGFPYNPFKKQA